MSRKELIEKAKKGRIDFGGNVFISGVWNGECFERFFVHYADKEGIHACKRGDEDFIDCVTPFDFDEVSNEVYARLTNDIIND